MSKNSVHRMEVVTLSRFCEGSRGVNVREILRLRATKAQNDKLVLDVQYKIPPSQVWVRVSLKTEGSVQGCYAMS